MRRHSLALALSVCFLTIMIPVLAIGAPSGGLGINVSSSQASEGPLMWADTADTLTAAAADTVTWHRYISATAPMSNDLQITYSYGVTTKANWSLQEVESFAAAWASPDSTDNALGYQASHFALTYDYFNRSDASDPVYGDSALDPDNLLLYRGFYGSASDEKNHCDLVLWTGTEASADSTYCNNRYAPLSSNAVADQGETDLFSWNSFVQCLGDESSWGTTHSDLFSRSMHEATHMVLESGKYDDSNSGDRLYDKWGTEWMAKTSEFLLGNSQRQAEFVNENYYRGSLYAKTPTDDTNTSQRVDNYFYVGKYVQWYLWGAYLAMHFGWDTPTNLEDDLIFQMLTDDHETLNGIGQSYVSLYGLALTLGSSAHDWGDIPYLETPGITGDLAIGSERLKRIFANCGVAEWANAPNLDNGQYGYPDGFTPTYQTPLFQDRNHYAHNADSIPPSVWVDSLSIGNVTTVSGNWVDYSDTTSAPLAMYAWQHQYLSFQADAELNDGACHELVVKIIAETDSIPFNDDSQYSYDLRAHLLAYDTTSSDSLWSKGADVEYIRELAVDTSEDTVLTIRVPCYGTLTKAATIALSMTEYEPVDLLYYLPTPYKLPGWSYSFTYTIEDGGISGTASDGADPDWSNYVCLGGDTASDEDLDIAPGTVVGIATDDVNDPGHKVGLNFAGGADIGGTAEAPIVFKSLSTSPGDDDWEGIEFTSDQGSASDFRLEHAVIQNAEIGIFGPGGNTNQSVTLNDLDISDCYVGLSSNQAYQEFDISDVRFSDISNEAMDHSANNASSTIDSVTVDNAFNGITISGSAAAHISDCLVEDSDYGFSFYNDNLVTNGLEAASIDNYGYRIDGAATTLYNSSAHNTNWGVYVTGGDAADAVLDSVKVHNNAIGVRCDDGPDIKIRDSEIYSHTSAGLMLDGENSYPDLGTSGDYGNNNFKKGTAKNKKNIIWWNSGTSSPAISAQGNYWGYSSAGQIQLSFTIYGTGTVDITNFVTSQISLRISTPSRLDGAMLSQNQPNPFNPLTKITFRVPMPMHGSLKIYDARGRLVRTLLDEDLTAGEHEVLWNGVANNGSHVSSGTYFYRLQTLLGAVSKSMILVK